MKNVCVRRVRDKLIFNIEYIFNIIIHKWEFGWTKSTALHLRSQFQTKLLSNLFSSSAIYPLPVSSARAVKSMLPTIWTFSQKMQMSMWLATSRVVRKRRRRKFTPPRRKINTSTRESNFPSTPSTALTVYWFLLRKRKRDPTKKDLPLLRTRNFHGSALG